MSTTPHTSPISPLPGQQDQSARLAASAEVGQAGGTHSYLWWQVLLTDPIGQWLCVAGRHGFAWSIKRSDNASMARVQRRRV